MTHPAAGAIRIDPIDWLSARPLIDQIWEIDSGPNRDLHGSREPRVDLHQVGHAAAIAAELHFRVALEIDFAHEPLGLAANVGGHGNALAQGPFAPQRRKRSP